MLKNMWMCLVLIGMVLPLALGSDVKVFSRGVRLQKGYKLRYRPGGYLSITFLVESNDFRMFEIQYNGSYNSFMLGPDIINFDGVKDHRITFSQLSTGIRINLKNLSLKDNGMKFSYSYIDSDLNKDTGFYVLDLIDKEEEIERDKGQLFMKLIYGCIAVVAVLVIVSTFVHFVKRGISPSRFCRGKKSNEDSSADHQEKKKDEENLFTDDEQETETL